MDEDHGLGVTIGTWYHIPYREFPICHILLRALVPLLPVERHLGLWAWWNMPVHSPT